MINARDFIFDSISSLMYNLQIAYFDNDYKKESIICEHTLDTYKSKYGKLKIINVYDKDTREFEITIVKETPIELHEINKIKQWLMPQDNKFRKLYINDPIYQGYYFNCKFSSIKTVVLNSGYHGLKCNIICDSQFVYSNNIIKEFNITTPTTNIIIINESCGNLKPMLKFKCNKENGLIKLTKNNEDIILNKLDVSEIITIDYKEFSIKSNKSSLVLDKFNKNFIDFKVGRNNFVLTGDVSEFSCEYQNYKTFPN